MGADGTVSWAELLAETEARLRGVDGDAARRHARWLCEEASGWEGAELDDHLHDPATVRGVAHLDAMVARRVEGEPIQYVLGHWPFRTLDLAVDRRVLIPRPETEQVVEVALAEVDRSASGEPVVVDLGTGSGAIGLAVAVERVRTAVWLTDVDADAMAVARANLAGVGRAATRVRVAQGSWFEALPGELRGGIDVVVSNPPYVAEDDEVDQVVGEWEPARALWAPDGGLADVRVIVEQAVEWLVPGGSLVVEIGSAQGERAHDLAVGAGYAEVEVLSDLSGRDRVLRARRRA